MSKAERLAEIVGAWREQRESDPEQIIAQHPDLADELRTRFQAIQLLENRFPERPHQIGEFKIIREIGRGGMGVVYEAEQASMQRRVALKVLFPSITSSSTAVKRFQREARAAGRLKHTNIVAVHQLGNENGIWFMAMELVEGRPLSDVIADLRRSKRKPRESRLARRARGTKSHASSAFTGTRTGTRAYYIRIAEMFADVADALQVAHDQGVIHRDIKPGNLLLDADGNLKLVDFGLARLENSATLTMTGDVVGTPYYMSPEQVLGKSRDLDHRTDVYSLGVTLCEALTLRPPFHGDNIQTVARRILDRDPIPPRRLDKTIPRDLETIILKALEKEPAKRYVHAEEMARDLRCFALGEAIRARRIGPVGRAWRKVRRHKVRASLAACLLIALAAGAALGLRAAADAERRRAFDYARLCARAYAAQVSRGAGDYAIPFDVGESPAELFTEAIDLLPDSPEAYFGRAWQVAAASRSAFMTLRQRVAAAFPGAGIT